MPISTSPCASCVPLVAFVFGSGYILRLTTKVQMIRHIAGHSTLVVILPQLKFSGHYLLSTVLMRSKEHFYPRLEPATILGTESVTRSSVEFCALGFARLSLVELSGAVSILNWISRVS